MTSGATPLKASAAMDVRGESGKTDKNTMLAGPQVRTESDAWFHCAPKSCRPSHSADELRVPSSKANINALKPEANANNRTITLPLCGCRMPKATTNASAGKMGTKPSKADKVAMANKVHGCVPLRKRKVSAK